MERARRRELAEQARRSREAGVYRIVHRPSGRGLVAATDDLAGARNRLTFAISTNAPQALDPRLRADAAADGLDSLVFEVLDVLEPAADGSPPSRADLDALAALWREREDPQASV